MYKHISHPGDKWETFHTQSADLCNCNAAAFAIQGGYFCSHDNALKIERTGRIGSDQSCDSRKLACLLAKYAIFSGSVVPGMIGRPAAWHNVFLYGAISPSQMM